MKNKTIVDNLFAESESALAPIIFKYRVFAVRETAEQYDEGKITGAELITHIFARLKM
jgi:hypothetical protein